MNVLVTYNPLFPKNTLYCQSYHEQHKAQVTRYYLSHAETINIYMAYKNHPFAVVPIIAKDVYGINIKQMFETIQEISDSWEIQPE